MSRVDICKVAVMTRNELEEFVAGVRWIAYKSREIESQSEERWDFSNESSSSL